MSALARINQLVRRMLVARGVTSSHSSIRGHLVHHYHLEGVGLTTPIVLLHGLGGSANGFARLLHRLSRRFRHVYALDLPGNGFSPEPGAGPLGLLEQLDVLEGFLEQQVREPGFLVGNSLGGAMGIEMAFRKPSAIKGLGLLSPAGARVSRERFDELNRSLQVNSVQDALALTMRLFHKTPWTFLPFAAELKQVYSTPSVKKLLQDARDNQRLHLSEQSLAGLSMPVLLLWGKSEKLLPYEGIHFFRAHLPPHAHIEEVEGFGHVPQMERPVELARRLVQFADEKLV